MLQLLLHIQAILKLGIFGSTDFQSLGLYMPFIITVKLLGSTGDPPFFFGRGGH